jgi:hypothetical protein
MWLLNQPVLRREPALRLEAAKGCLNVPSVTAGTWHAAQPVAPTPAMLRPTGRQVEGGDVTAIFLLVPGVVFALAAAGMVWIRLATAEYRHNWSAPQEESQGAYARR